MSSAMRPWERLPRISLRAIPAPLVQLPRFSRTLGADVWMKRDDVGDLPFAGNKARKLEFLLADAIDRDCDVVVAVGAAQSNFARAVAAAAARVGMPCILLLGGEAPHRLAGNALLAAMCGAQLRFQETEAWDELVQRLDATCSELETLGSRPFPLPIGGSVPLGVVAFAAAYAELVDELDELQLAPDCIVHASSSGGTQAGLELGRRIVGRGPVIHAVDVAKTGGDLRPVVAALATSAAELLGVRETWRQADIKLDESQLGQAYGVPTDAALEAIDLLARTEGIICDPVYTGKALAALVARARAGAIGPQLFWHTGGVPAIFDPRYTDSMLRAAFD